MVNHMRPNLPTTKLRLQGACRAIPRKPMPAPPRPRGPRADTSMHDGAHDGAHAMRAPLWQCPTRSSGRRAGPRVRSIRRASAIRIPSPILTHCSRVANTQCDHQAVRKSRASADPNPCIAHPLPLLTAPACRIAAPPGALWRAPALYPTLSAATVLPPPHVPARHPPPPRASLRPQTSAGGEGEGCHAGSATRARLVSSRSDAASFSAGGRCASGMSAPFREPTAGDAEIRGGVDWSSRSSAVPTASVDSLASELDVSTDAFARWSAAAASARRLDGSTFASAASDTGAISTAPLSDGWGAGGAASSGSLFGGDAPPSVAAAGGSGGGVRLSTDACRSSTSAVACCRICSSEPGCPSGWPAGSCIHMIDWRRDQRLRIAWSVRPGSRRAISYHLCPSSATPRMMMSSSERVHDVRSFFADGSLPAPLPGLAPSAAAPPAAAAAESQRWSIFGGARYCRPICATASPYARANASSDSDGSPTSALLLVPPVLPAVAAVAR
mmetsp:Transcript_31419/g.83200  ORF Transcript_31419/g.83200 Transcript_31419/m.83200 type:complete len:500 (+) Transcript_31419:61-1560(+)